MIDFNKTRQYTLSIRLSTGGFCFTVHNPENVGEYAYQPYRVDTQKSLTANLKTALKEVPLLKHAYGNVNVILPDTNYTLVPREYYVESFQQEFYKQSYPFDAGNDVILSNAVADGQIVVLFAVESQLNKYIIERFPKAKIYTSVSSLINYGAEKSCTISRKYYMAYLHSGQVDLMCFEKAAPLFVNTFKYKETADAMYYLLNSWSILGLSQTEDTLHIVGSPSRNVKKLQRDAAQFIQHVCVIRPAEEFHSAELARIDELPFDLQAHIACE